jgi:hypothetical protein
MEPSRKVLPKRFHQIDPRWHSWKSRTPAKKVRHSVSGSGNNVRESGTDVMVFENIFAKKIANELAF